MIYIQIQLVDHRHSNKNVFVKPLFWPQAGMKQPSKGANPAGSASRLSLRFPAKDLAQVRAIAAAMTERLNAKRKALLLAEPTPLRRRWPGHCCAISTPPTSPP
jgi:hypothetical protein